MCLHGVDPHSLMLCPHSTPSHPNAQAHVYEFRRSTQVPHLPHGADAQSSMIVWQLNPAHPTEQLHLYAFTPSVQFRGLLRQGLEAHSFTFVAHLEPCQPAGHIQIIDPRKAMQIPLFAQGALAHGGAVGLWVGASVDSPTFPKMPSASVCSIRAPSPGAAGLRIQRAVMEVITSVHPSDQAHAEFRGTCCCLLALLFVQVIFQL